MTGIRSLWTAAILVIATSTVGNGATLVRSGEHEGFTRLVFADEPGRAWDVRRSAPGRVDVDFSDGAPELDVGEVFDRIARRRISGIRAVEGTLGLTLACDCPVEVSQIPTGHIVIDVRDGPPLPKPWDPVLASVTLPLVLPPIPMSIRAPTPPGDALPAIDRKQIAEVGPPQVRRHASGPVSLIPDPPDMPDTSPPSAGCEAEHIASAALLADPMAARALIDGGLAGVLDGEDRLDPAVVRSLATSYLAAGWGAEAAQLAARDPADDGIVAIVAAALDDEPYPEGTRLDAACGPATTVLVLLDRDGTEGWDRADVGDLLRFVDAFQPVTRTHLGPRLASRLEQLGETDVLDGLGDLQDAHRSLPIPSPRIAAGTDIRAVQAATTLLKTSNGQGNGAPEPYIVNAFAIRPSLPDGHLRRELETALAEALVLSRRPAEAVAMVRDGAARADDLLITALDALAPEEAAEFAVRLRPHLTAGSDAAQRAAGLFEPFGLEETARSFSSEAPPSLPRAADARGALADDWLERDMPAMAEADPRTWTDRHRLAREIVSRNETPPPTTDLAIAGATLERSRAISSLVATLLGAEGGT